jgi:hypothetical protein
MPHISSKPAALGRSNGSAKIDWAQKTWASLQLNLLPWHRTLSQEAISVNSNLQEVGGILNLAFSVQPLCLSVSVFRCFSQEDYHRDTKLLRRAEIGTLPK